jgi:hypothetical protein
MNKQEYSEKPLHKDDVRGLSSKTIFKFFSKGGAIPDSDYHPHDVDDWERNRALLLWYPEWKARLHEMEVVSLAWSRLTKNWAAIEALYDEDYRTHGNKAFGKGKCDAFIRSLLT